MRGSITLVLHSAARPFRDRRLGLRATVAFVLALLALFLVWSGWLYPLRPDVIGGLGRPLAPLFPGAWGGPTLLGAWAVHALIALGLQAACVMTIRAVRRP